MEIFLVLAVILGVAVYLMKKRNITLSDLMAKFSAEQSKSEAKIVERVVEAESAQEVVDSVQTEAAVEEKQETVESVNVSAEVAPPVQEVVSVAPSIAVAEQKIPEDSTLKRHYLSNRQAEREAITNPYPTDSTLRRHYQSMRAIAPSQSIAVETVKAVTPSGPVADSKSVLAEDSALNLAQVRADIESQIGPRPTDSTLSRHYDSLLKAKLDAFLASSEV